jgi:phosphopentomutase
VYGAAVPARSLGKRATFADIGQSLAGHFALERMAHGTDFLN